MIIDEINLEVFAGKGGDGCISFRREKYVPKGGPDGGNGGKGGNVYVEVVHDISALRAFRNIKVIRAEKGTDGRDQKQHGKAGNDTILHIPIGTTIHDEIRGYTWECDEVGKKMMIARGGNGGRGNHEFRSNEEKAPQFAEAGEDGQHRKLHISLALIADVGLIGLPSAGKSSLLNELTAADVKVADYPFTTLEPNLGSMDGVILADIPGLIEGAHEGKGLGLRFLKHIEKTKILVHCIDISSPSIFDAYQVIRDELGFYNPELLKKKEIVVLTKSDLLTEAEVEKKRKAAKKKFKKVLVVSILDPDSITKLKSQIITSS